MVRLLLVILVVAGIIYAIRGLLTNRVARSEAIPLRLTDDQLARARSVVQPILNKLNLVQREVIRIALIPTETDSVGQSKVGGLPYWPKDQPLPADSSGQVLILLAQINFADLPSNHQFPEQGILQFFIASNDLYGLDFDHQQRQLGFRVSYWPKIELSLASLVQEWPLPPNGEALTPHDPSQSLVMQFELDSEPMSVGDRNIEQLLGANIWQIVEPLAEQNELTKDAILDLFADGAGHKLGGYPYFTQEDPREPADSLRLLFQLDTEDDRIMWGDVGVGNFFISDQALADRDFSQVLYNWDCH